MINGTAVSAVLLDLPFTGQVYSIDLVPPDTSITAQPPALTNSASARFTFTGTDTGVGVAGFQCQLDGAGYTNCTSPVNFNGLPDGSHTFTLQATDNAGNVWVAYQGISTVSEISGSATPVATPLSAMKPGVET